MEEKKLPRNLKDKKNPLKADLVAALSTCKALMDEEAKTGITSIFIEKIQPIMLKLKSFKDGEIVAFHKEVSMLLASYQKLTNQERPSPGLR